tara:strand:- start:4699 stop:5646 length:948 start_codon:yes stop_codon:yes gene_type:complete
MAVKPITNKQVVASSDINRSKQISTKNETIRGNRGKTIVPGKDFTKNYSITLKDIDTAVLGHIKDVIKPKVQEANETIDVTVMYGNEERWKSVRKRGVMRDRNGSIILPLIMLRRTDIAKNTLSGQGFDHDVQGKYAQVIRNSHWSKDNRYSRFSVLTGIKPNYESVVTGMPDFADITYEFVLWTNFIEQMNPLIETFVAQSNTYWGDSTEYKFLSSLDTITDATEMNADGERFVKSTFSITTNAYLLPEYLNSVITNKKSNMSKQISTSRVVFGYEGDATDKQIRGDAKDVVSDLVKKIEDGEGNNLMRNVKGK